jgi:hypothetical protein
LVFGERYKDIGCQVCKMLSRTVSGGGGGGAATKIPEKIQSVGFVSGARQCYEHNMSGTTNNFIFAEKKEWPEKAQNMLCNVWLRKFEPGPNPARARTLSVLPGPGPRRPPAYGGAVIEGRTFLKTPLQSSGPTADSYVVQDQFAGALWCKTSLPALCSARPVCRRPTRRTPLHSVCTVSQRESGRVHHCQMSEPCLESTWLHISDDPRSAGYNIIFSQKSSYMSLSKRFPNENRVRYCTFSK